MSWRLGLLIVIPLLAGCLGDAPATVDLATIPRAIASPHVVVGIVETAINPYHEQFQVPGAQLPAEIIDAATGLPPIPLHLAQEGSIEERLQKDAATWDSLESGRLYWFVGTRLLVTSFYDSPDAYRFSTRFPEHGTDVASTVLNASRDAWVVVAQPVPELPDEATDTLSGAIISVGEAARWLRSQPWVDVISLSIGLAIDPPILWGSVGLTGATQEAVEEGKLVVASAGNYPTVTIPGGVAGPPWVVSVGGVESPSHGEQPRARKMADVVSDYTRRVAGSGIDDYHNNSGTSFSAPYVAGTLAQSILTLRLEAGYVGGIEDGVLCPCGGRDWRNQDFREALNRTAVYWDTTGYRVVVPSDPVELVFLTTIPVLPTPWVQMGWGYVGPDASEAIVRALHGEAPPPKPDAAVMYMAAQQELRESFWATQPR